jgi:hypothetical protein
MPGLAILLELAVRVVTRSTPIQIRILAILLVHVIAWCRAGAGVLISNNHPLSTTCTSFRPGSQIRQLLPVGVFLGIAFAVPRGTHVTDFTFAGFS